MNRFEVHTHTDYSNIRLIDCINRVEPLLDRAVEMGLSGLAITDHECLSSHVRVQKHVKKIRKTNPDFKVALGNEIYLVRNREDRGQKYFHFILMAKNSEGHKALSELSSKAWLNSFMDRATRVPTLYSELIETVQKYPNSLVGTTACLGGELSYWLMEEHNALRVGNVGLAAEMASNADNFVANMKKLLGEDFYLEIAPACSKEQIMVNKKIEEYSKKHGVKMVIGCDAHYLLKEDREVHKAYLNSKDEERETDDFYAYCYLQGDEDIQEHLTPSGLDTSYDELVANSYEIYEKIEYYELFHKQTIPTVILEDFPKKDIKIQNCPIIEGLYKSDKIEERFWINKCIDAMNEQGLYSQDYLDRIETEADVILSIGTELGDSLFHYFTTFHHYVELFWACGTTVEPGRGSATGFLSNYLLGITQLDPIKENLPYWRFLNKERAELPDIDIDIAPSKRPRIFKEIKAERRHMLQGGLTEIEQAELGMTQIATFGTEATKSCINTACRGYRSEAHPNGLGNDVGAYLTALVPEERGFQWSLKEVVNGDPEKQRRPVHAFNKEVAKYPGLVEIMFGIEGLIKQRGSHAAGIIMFEEDPYKFGAFMRSPDGTVTTQYDLHDCEDIGMTKYDFLVIQASDKLIACIELLQEYNELDPDKSLREIYHELLHPSVIDTSDQKIWDALSSGSVMDAFQFSTDVGLTAAKKLKCQTPKEMADANAIMRLMASEKGAETPIDKYHRFKMNYPHEWEKEMQIYKVTPEERAIIEHIYAPAYGCPALQEDLMIVLMEAIGFTLGEANNARKIVGKKLMSKIPELRQQIYDKAPRKGLADYIWETAIKPQLGYAFSLNHSLPYSYICIQMLVLATKFDPIYWAAACLGVNSGMEVDEGAKEKSTNYGKVATALGEVKSRGVDVSLININRSGLKFLPDVEHNQILYGLKGLLGLNQDVIDSIISLRPYTSFEDFLNRVPGLKSPAIVSLIKAGAFNEFYQEWSAESGRDPRQLCMARYLATRANLKKKITLQNMATLVKHNLLPQPMIALHNFNGFLRAHAATPDKQYYLLDGRAYEFYHERSFPEDCLEVHDGYVYIKADTWAKVYENARGEIREYVVNNQEKLIKEVNDRLFAEEYAKYAAGTLATWEMDSMGLYYGEHELADVDIDKYGIAEFHSLPAEPIVAKQFKARGEEGRMVDLYQLDKIIGTVIDKNPSKGIATILTTSGVVNVKYTKEYFAMFNKQIKETLDNGKGRIVEKGWFTKGTMIMATGYRMGDMFRAKSYKDTATHQLYKIVEVCGDGSILLAHNRDGSLEEI